MSKKAAVALEGVGPKMRAMRLKRKVSLRALARLVNVTPSLISQIETGKINPSVSSLYAISMALDVPMDSFFGGSTKAGARAIRTARIPEGEEAALESETVLRLARGSEGVGNDMQGTANPVMGIRSPVARAGTREVITIDGFGGTVFWERLTSEHDPMVDFLEIRYEPGAASAQNQMRHSGREFGLVLEGELTVSLAFEEHVLGVGDSIAFESATPHRLANQGTEPVRALWVVINRRPPAEGDQNGIG
jgi:transcriptional regulator with XRE-family HTH domain/quercetin dioxygenase-like cupin family protein